MRNPDTLAVELYHILMDRSFAIPDDLRGELVRAFAPTNHAHVALIQAVEAVYCCVDDAPVELLQWAADAADAGAALNLGGLATDGRGVGISNALRQLPGVNARDTGSGEAPAPRNIPGLNPEPAPEEPVAEEPTPEEPAPTA